MSKKRINLIPANKVKLVIFNGKKLIFQDNDILGFVESKVTEFGNSAKVNFFGDYIGKRVYVVICK